jgi:hypothetical protein
MNIVRSLVDERFLVHRLRSSSRAGIATSAMALVVFEYRLLVKDVWSWDLLAVGATFVLVKLGLMLWYAATD